MFHRHGCKLSQPYRIIHECGYLKLISYKNTRPHPGWELFVFLYVQICKHEEKSERKIYKEIGEKFELKFEAILDFCWFHGCLREMRGIFFWGVASVGAHTFETTGDSTF